MVKAVVGSVKTIGLAYQWTIEKYSVVSEIAVTEIVIRSPQFSTTLTDGRCLDWQLEMFPNGIAKKNENHVSVYLNLLNEEDFSAIWSVSMLECVERKLFIKSMYRSQNPKNQVIQKWGWANFYTKVGLPKNFLNNDTLVITCSFSFENDVKPIRPKIDVSNTSKPYDHYKYLLETGDLSDVTFIIGERSLKLHKAILGSMSPVFREAFNGKNNDIVKNVKVNTEISYDVMMEMMRYIYTKKVKKLDDFAADLYVAAHKYSVDGLMKLCEEKLCINLSINNAHEFLELAVKFDMLILKPKAVEFVVTNLMDFTMRKEYQQLDVECVRELLRAVAVKEESREKVGFYVIILLLLLFFSSILLL